MTLLKNIFFTVALCTLSLRAEVPPLLPAYDATSVYQQVEIEGFTILINPRVLAHEKAAGAMRAELERQLREIVRVVPDDALRAFRGYRIWVEWQQTKGGACFHPSARWLAENGYNPEKAGDIEISHTIHFTDWSERHQPCMVLHEMAHAYHHRVLGLDDRRINDAFRNAERAGLYESVAHVDGGKPRRAYAMTNAKEYFSELSEAYFGRNDFFPFNREELKEHDPVGYRMMVDCWGAPKK